jgi:hypothetical protein
MVNPIFSKLTGRKLNQNFQPGSNLLKEGFLELKRRIQKSATKTELPHRKRKAITLELTKYEYEMLCDGLDRASIQGKMEDKNRKFQETLTAAKEAYEKLGRNSDGYRAACKVLGFAPGKRQKKYQPKVHGLLYKHLIEVEKMTKLEAIEEISKLLNLKPATVFKELKVVKKQKDSILKKIKLPRTT